MISKLIFFGSFFLMSFGTAGAMVAAAPMNERWGLFAAFSAMIISGIILRRYGLHHASQNNTGETSMDDLAVLLQNIDGNLARIIEDKGSISEKVLCSHLYDLIITPVLQFKNSRTLILDAWGMSDYAIIMSEFSEGERLLNRAVSASSDGYLVEAYDSLQDASPSIDSVKARFQKLLESNA